jgi:hypothetical protein
MGKHLASQEEHLAGQEELSTATTTLRPAPSGEGSCCGCSNCLDIRWFEDAQTAAGVEEARAWAAALPGRLGQGDLFLSANTDEVLSRAALQVRTSSSFMRETVVPPVAGPLLPGPWWGHLRGPLDAGGQPGPGPQVITVTWHWP